MKGLKSQSLRDHMTNLELVLNMLAEASTTEITREKDARGLPRNRKAAKQGGAIAGRARKEIESRSGRQVISAGNFLRKRLKK